MISAEVGVLHKVQLVYGIHDGAGAKVERLVGRVPRVLVWMVLHLQILKAHGVRGPLIQLIEIATVQGYVWTAEAVAWVRWVICN